ncbi:hypothetical protein [Domibacillus robiginosus]|uniref:hypothetical protein n=1 Tax=Domibacillus robiginosus TaxID=1071054 RepID=UPI00067D8DB7|nr:hypothetical protein [Domibacillus robiginosus]
MATKIAGLTVVKSATLSKVERVEVYFHVLKGGFSIRSKEKQNPFNGKVIAHASHVLIEQATFHYSKDTLARIHAKKQKEVYAVVRDYFIGTSEMDSGVEGFTKGYCNPYVTGNFINWETKGELSEADLVYFYDRFFSYK